MSRRTGPIQFHVPAQTEQPASCSGTGWCTVWISNVAPMTHMHNIYRGGRRIPQYTQSAWNLCQREFVYDWLLDLFGRLPLLRLSGVPLLRHFQLGRHAVELPCVLDSRAPK